jgi:pyruvate/2-oxoglutarate dehydrogenase complex dihydrolipoamide dehydrogenase (E3) component
VTSPNDHFDLVVIGAGSGGLVGARFAAQLGAKVALVEKNRIGGDCTWTGCIPSKALLKAAKVAHEVRTAVRYGVVTSPPTVDMCEVREYVRGAIQAVYRFETPEALAGEGIDVVLGEARFLNDSAIAVADRTMRSKAFLLTTGARPIVPQVTGLRDVPFITYEQLFENDALPKSLTIVGGGPIGMEMAQAYQRLGAQVTVVSNHVLPKEDPDVQQLIQRILEREGVRFVSDKAKSARKDGDAIIVITDQQETRGDMLMIAVGRKPNTEGLDLEKAGVEYSPHGVSVDDRLRTNVKHIYAAGDVTGSYQFTHYAGWQAFQAVRNALLPGSSSGVSNLVPWVTFTDPEVAHIGATEEQARAENGNRVCVYRRELRQVDRAVCENDLSGFLKIITKPDGAILGASIVSARAGEAIAEIVVAMKQRMKIGDLAGTIHPYPTYSTAVQQMAAQIAVEHLLSGTSGKLVRWLSKAVR